MSFFEWKFFYFDLNFAQVYKSGLVQVMGWRLSGGKPLPDLMMTQSDDENMHHQALMS